MQIHSSHLFEQLKINIQRNVKKDLQIKYPATGNYMEFDIWIPEYQLSFEFQDTYHYLTMWYYHQTQDYIQQRDNIKHLMAHQNGLALVTVPCWWDGRPESLAGTIWFQRPDLPFLTPVTGGDPIALNPPHNFFQPFLISGVGELMLASFPIHTVALSDYIWWIGEKYDGVRYCWDGENNLGFTRYGKELSLPNEFTNLLPEIFIDAELWFGRGQFAYTYALSSEGTTSGNFDSMRMLSFDVPEYSMQQFPYEERYNHLLLNVCHDHPFNIIASRVSSNKCKVTSYVQEIIEGEGEGVILQRRASVYEQGRSQLLIKLKTSQSDQEAIIVDIRNQSVLMKLPNGVTVTVPSENVQVTKLAVGDVVAFSFENHARRDLPVCPKIYRIRTDVSWEDIVHSYVKERQYLTETSQAKGFTMQAKGYWTARNMRLFMEKFAKSRNADPLQPETWRNSLKAFAQSKGGRTILRKFKNGYYQAVRKLFPEIKFDSSFPQAYNSLENRRRFFENYANKKGFDPLKPGNWYLHSKNIMTIKGASRVLFYHKSSLFRALSDLFPNIGLDKSKFPFFQSVWSREEYRRKFFIDFARANDFDPLVPSNWYTQSRSKIMSAKGAHQVIFHHERSIPKALLALFPKIGLEKSKFFFPHTKTPESRRKFFESYALENNFDALKPSNWYTQQPDKILAMKGAHRVLFYHSYSISRALLDLFPDIGLERSKLPSQQMEWKTPESRRGFFENFAIAHEFNPLIPEYWYQQSLIKIKASKSAHEVISHHGYSVSRALLELFPNIGLEEAKLIPKSMWSKAENRRKFFIEYATEKNFDPLIADNWYSKRKIASRKGARRLLGYYNNSIPHALSDLFPNIGLDHSKFKANSLN